MGYQTAGFSPALKKPLIGYWNRSWFPGLNRKILLCELWYLVWITGKTEVCWCQIQESFFRISFIGSSVLNFFCVLTSQQQPFKRLGNKHTNEWLKNHQSLISLKNVISRSSRIILVKLKWFFDDKLEQTGTVSFLFSSLGSCAPVVSSTSLFTLNCANTSHCLLDVAIDWSWNSHQNVTNPGKQQRDKNALRSADACCSLLRLTANQFHTRGSKAGLSPSLPVTENDDNYSSLNMSLIACWAAFFHSLNPLPL